MSHIIDGLSRRSMLLGTGGLAAAAALAACSTGTSSNLTQAAADITTVANVLAAFGPALSAIPGAGPVIAVATQYAPIVAALANGLTSTNGATTVATVEADVQKVLTAAGDPAVMSVLPANVKTALSDIQILLPAVEALVAGLAAASPAADAARMRLEAFAAGGKH